jgi:hypothetical protein
MVEGRSSVEGRRSKGRAGPHVTAIIGPAARPVEAARQQVERGLSERAGAFVGRVAEFESGQSVPQSRTVRKLVCVLGLGLVDVQ